MTNGGMAEEARFWSKVDKNGPAPAHRPDLGPCWLWTACKAPFGYGRFYVSKVGADYAHRVAFRRVHGPIPDKLELDHLCRRRDCVNPSHLEAVTHRVNALRGEGFFAISARGKRPAEWAGARKGECPRGHPLVEENLYVFTRADSSQRRCHTCKIERDREYRSRRTAH